MKDIIFRWGFVFRVIWKPKNPNETLIIDSFPKYKLFYNSRKTTVYDDKGFQKALLTIENENEDLFKVLQKLNKGLHAFKMYKEFF